MKVPCQAPGSVELNPRHWHYRAGRPQVIMIGGHLSPRATWHTIKDGNFRPMASPWV
jgi:hypothetical protein